MKLTQFLYRYDMVQDQHSKGYEPIYVSLFTEIQWKNSVEKFVCASISIQKNVAHALITQERSSPGVIIHFKDKIQNATKTRTDLYEREENK